jgi:hypothetical protein
LSVAGNEKTARAIFDGRSCSCEANAIAGEAECCGSVKRQDAAVGADGVVRVESQRVAGIVRPSLVRPECERYAEIGGSCAEGDSTGTGVEGETAGSEGKSPVGCPVGIDRGGPGVVEGDAMDAAAALNSAVVFPLATEKTAELSVWLLAGAPVVPVPSAAEFQLPAVFQRPVVVFQYFGVCACSEEAAASRTKTATDFRRCDKGQSEAKKEGLDFISTGAFRFFEGPRVLKTARGPLRYWQPAEICHVTQTDDNVPILISAHAKATVRRFERTGEDSLIFAAASPARAAALIQKPGERRRFQSSFTRILRNRTVPFFALWTCNPKNPFE